MGKQEKSNSPWVWVALLLILASFAAFILFLDQKIVHSTQNKPSTSPESDDRNKPTIDFYSVLPDRKVEIPVTDEQKEGIDNPSINKSDGEQVILQVGSFQSAGEADSLKAELAFLGLEAKIASAKVNSDTWHRVQIGPFASNSALSRAKNLLLENKIQYMQRNLE